MPNLAPDIESADTLVAPSRLIPSRLTAEDILGEGLPTAGGKRPTDSTEPQPSEPKKKKYAKEAWPGKRPGFLVGPSVA